jgi:plasmid maintenance system antidote protein VapI
MSQLWLKDVIKNRGIKVKACCDALGVTHPTWNNLVLEPHKMNCLQVQNLANLLGMKPHELFQMILHYKNIDELG